MNFEKFKKSKEAADLATLYKDTTLFHFSRTWDGKNFKLALVASGKGVKLFYMDTVFFSNMWHETAANGGEEIPENIRAAFVEDAKAVARQFYGKVDYLTK